MRALCDRQPDAFTRWLFERECDGRYTGLVMAWPAGHSTPIHDHAGLWGIELVLQGSLGVDDYEIDPATGQPHFLGTTVLEEGQSCAEQFPGTIDGNFEQNLARVAGRDLSGRRPAVTLHLYGGLLEDYRNFDLVEGGRYVALPAVARIEGSIGPARVRGA